MKPETKYRTLLVMLLIGVAAVVGFHTAMMIKPHPPEQKPPVVQPVPKHPRRN